MSRQIEPTILRSGLNELFNLAGGIDSAITHIGIGTARYTPDQEQTASRGEILRVPILDMTQPAENQAMFYAEVADWDGELTPCYELVFYLESGNPFAIYSSDEVELVLLKGSPNDLYYTLALDAVPAGKLRIVSTERVFNPSTQDTDSINYLSAASLAQGLNLHQHARQLGSQKTAIDALSQQSRAIADKQRDMDSAIQIKMAAIDESAGEQSANYESLSADVKKMALAVSSAMETDRAFRRDFGQDGVYRVKSSYGRNKVPFYDQTHDISYSALNHHNHWDTVGTNGLAQFSVVVAGVVIQMRHTDYTRRQPENKGCDYLGMRLIDYPSVPSDIKGTVAQQVAKAKQYFLARENVALRKGLADFKGAHQVYMGYVEVYPEKLDAAQLETFAGTRHQLNSSSIEEAFNEFVYWDWTGMQDPLQNYGNFPLLVHGFDDDGNIAFGSWKARFCMAPIGSYEDYPLHELLSETDDVLSDLRYGSNAERTRLDRFDIDHNKLIEMVGKIPGLDGYGSNMTATFSVGSSSYTLNKFLSKTKLNAAYYHDRYSLQQGDADGRTSRQNGFSRSSFVARNTRKEILKVSNDGNEARISLMIPIELVVVDFRQEWNPLGLKNISDMPYNPVNPKTSTVGRSQGDPLDGYMERGLLFYKTPAELFSGFDSNDPADTASSYLWIKDKNGKAQRVSPSGVPPELPRINGKQFRQRWMIYKLYDEGSVSYRDMRERIKRESEFQAAATLKNMTDIYRLKQQLAGQKEANSEAIASLKYQQTQLTVQNEMTDAQLAKLANDDTYLAAASLKNTTDISKLKES